MEGPWRQHIPVDVVRAAASVLLEALLKYLHTAGYPDEFQRVLRAMNTTPLRACEVLKWKSELYLHLWTASRLKSCWTVDAQ